LNVIITYPRNQLVIFKLLTWSTAGAALFAASAETIC